MQWTRESGVKEITPLDSMRFPNPFLGDHDMFSDKINFKKWLDSGGLPSPSQGLWITVDKDLQVFETKGEFSAFIFPRA
ncbi:hypothetical protein HED51_04345 [Ochrobactrum grignonense]|nr:hypothetical protein [Brucella grignonensis]